MTKEMKATLNESCGKDKFLIKVVQEEGFSA